MRGAVAGGEPARLEKQAGRGEPGGADGEADPPADLARRVVMVEEPGQPLRRIGLYEGARPGQIEQEDADDAEGVRG